HGTAARARLRDRRRPRARCACPKRANSTKGRHTPGGHMSVLTAERLRSRVLVTFIGTGLAFMLIPGTFLGVWNLVQISGRESVSLVSPAWLQAHGHAQIFGWIGSFILGIGFYSLPASRQHASSGYRQAWIAWGLWTTGVAMRWATNVYGGPWRVLLPAS